MCDWCLDINMKLKR